MLEFDMYLQQMQARNSSADAKFLFLWFVTPWHGVR